MNQQPHVPGNKTFLSAAHSDRKNLKPQFIILHSAELLFILNFIWFYYIPANLHVYYLILNSHSKSRRENGKFVNILAED